MYHLSYVLVFPLITVNSIQTSGTVAEGANLGEQHRRLFDLPNEYVQLNELSMTQVGEKIGRVIGVREGL